MEGINLYFDIGDISKIDGRDYSIQGFIKFLNVSSNSRWTEYKLKQVNSGEIKWLSIDDTDQDCALYTMCEYSSDFQEENIIKKGYKEVDYGTATVISFRGNVDVDINERVDYREFEDFSEKNIIAIEKWGNESEYSTGYYVDNEKIEKIPSRSSSGYKKASAGFQNRSSNVNNGLFSNKIAKIVTSIFIAIIVIVLISIFQSKDETAMSDFIKSSSNFTYTTSITSDGEGSEKADVYLTSLSIEAASKNIIDGIKGNVADVQENAEDSSVAILTDKEYALVYSDESGQTLVQISTRLYAYSSTQNPYRSRLSTGRYFRMFYYSRAFTSDSSRYSGNSSGYGGYSDGTINSNSSDKYKSYSDSSRQSARQSSTSSRTSSGGGTSSGK